MPVTNSPRLGRQISDTCLTTPHPTAPTPPSRSPPEHPISPRNTPRDRGQRIGIPANADCIPYRILEVRGLVETSERLRDGGLASFIVLVGFPELVHRCRLRLCLAWFSRYVDELFFVELLLAIPTI